MDDSLDPRKVFQVYLPMWAIDVLKKEAIRTGCVRIYGGKLVANVSEFLRRWTYQIMQDEEETKGEI